jgi:hypothetical protein
LVAAHAARDKDKEDSHTAHGVARHLSWDLFTFDIRHAIPVICKHARFSLHHLRDNLLRHNVIVCFVQHNTHQPKDRPDEDDPSQ